MNVNATQVGGTHYQSAYQHWDLVINVLKCRYLEGCITKYVTRWRNKNGLEDLRKSRHYLTKLLELRDYRPMRYGLIPQAVHHELSAFYEANKLEVPERSIIGRVALWRHRDDLVMALAELDCLIESVEPK